MAYRKTPADDPMTARPQGLILHTPNGSMSAQLRAPGRQPFASGDWFAGTADDYRAEATS